MLRITTAVAEDGVLVIGIAGRLTQDGCDAIDQILKDALTRPQRVMIDLAGLKLVDRPSVQYLANLHRQRLPLINLPSYVRRWLERVSNED